MNDTKFCTSLSFSSIKHLFWRHRKLSIDRLYDLMIWCKMLVFKHVLYMSVLRQIRDKPTCQFIILVWFIYYKSCWILKFWCPEKLSIDIAFRKSFKYGNSDNFWYPLKIEYPFILNCNSFYKYWYDKKMHHYIGKLHNFRILQ